MSQHGHSHDDDHGHCHGEAHTHSPPPDATTAAETLYPHIDHAHIQTFSAAEESMGRAIVRPWDERMDTTKVLESEDDEGVVMIIPFDGLVKLKTVLLRTPADASAPKTLHLLANPPCHLDFSSALSHPRTQSLDLALGTSDIMEYPVKIPKFSNLRSLGLIFEGGDEDDDGVLRAWYLGFRGEWKEMKKEPVIAIYEAAANPADHKVTGRSEVGGMQGLGGGRGY
ncbi:DUF1000-domain-containing protein [Saitoella complicata NRRL Y-17804]|uniref:DUF1000-domain-containing protein n=1 Tax=Saitoella complicata (strain BCRC 22490 / CBS 7301 / JCM 7358 / NBRC 10748 / NRRL Y-17804) TaxID=698492 RepID=UPI0008675069|nr:DUF1000-domain-containing protein [Saitoella complicata NRRL Y-17804]ODQ54278.1 DUF1000-domain-containing protein [Saitoella complicata NRRL Y-17804]